MDNWKAQKRAERLVLGSLIGAQGAALAVAAVLCWCWWLPWIKPKKVEPVPDRPIGVPWVIDTGHG